MTMMRSGSVELFRRRKIGRGCFQFVPASCIGFKLWANAASVPSSLPPPNHACFPKAIFQTTCFLFQAACKTVFGQQRRNGYTGRRLSLGGDVQQNRAVAYTAGQPHGHIPNLAMPPDAFGA